MFSNHYGHQYHQNTFQRYYNVFWPMQHWWKCRIRFTLKCRPRFLNKLKSVRRRGDTGTKYQELFPRVFPRCSIGKPHNLFLNSKWFFHDCCLCNRCNVMVNVLYLLFDSSVAVHCPPFASEEVFWANLSWEKKLESSFPFFSCTLYEK